VFNQLNQQGVSMVAVIFEVKPKIEGKEEYMKIAAGLRSFLENRDGFISIERFQSLEHRAAQKKGRESLFHSYRIRVAQVVRDYTESDRSEAPLDSNDMLV
jgi:heme-degrading monooxygenase HmoA